MRFLALIFLSSLVLGGSLSHAATSRDVDLKLKLTAIRSACNSATDARSKAVCFLWGTVHLSEGLIYPEIARWICWGAENWDFQVRCYQHVTAVIEKVDERLIPIKAACSAMSDKRSQALCYREEFGQLNDSNAFNEVKGKRGLRRFRGVSMGCEALERTHEKVKCYNIAYRGHLEGWSRERIANKMCSVGDSRLYSALCYRYMLRQ